MACLFYYVFFQNIKVCTKIKKYKRQDIRNTAWMNPIDHYKPSFEKDKGKSDFYQPLPTGISHSWLFCCTGALPWIGSTSFLTENLETIYKLKTMKLNRVPLFVVSGFELSNINMSRGPCWAFRCIKKCLVLWSIELLCECSSEMSRCWYESLYGLSTMGQQIIMLLLIKIHSIKNLPQAVVIKHHCLPF